MIRLSLQLALRSGREGLLRLLITAAAVAVSVALLLGVLAEDYYTIMGIGLAGAFGVITLTLPLLRRMTAPSTIRFE